MLKSTLTIIHGSQDTNYKTLVLNIHTLGIIIAFLSIYTDTYLWLIKHHDYVVASLLAQQPVCITFVWCEVTSMSVPLHKLIANM